MTDFSNKVSGPSLAFRECDTKEFAFTSLGVDYYQHTHRGFNMTYAKWYDYTAMTEYHDIWQLTQIDVNEFFRIERDSVSRIRALVGSGQLEEAAVFLDELAVYQTLMEVRRGLKHPESLYREASVFYFDQSEDPARYDEIYAQEKISRWLQDPELINSKDLFFSPVSRFIPLDALQMPTEETAMMISQLTQQVQTGTLTAVLASEKARTLGDLSNTNDSTLRNMHLRLDVLKQYEHLSGLLFRNTSTLEENGTNRNSES